MKPVFRNDEVLTEENIKKSVLRFLKGYYRKRQRAGETLISSDMRGLGGIIADGYLTFAKEDGTWFVATFEATSQRKRDEVRFRMDKRIIIWDGVAFAAFCTALYLVFAYLQDFYTVKEAGRLGAFFLLALVGITLFSAHQFFCLLVKPRRYRYIYAVEQFKQYHADEQWIAVGENVFTEKNGRYFKELRHQCTYNGFGLIIVEAAGDQLKPILFITPSRQQLFGQRRRIVQFFQPATDWKRRFQQSASHRWWRRWFGRSRRRFNIDAEHLNRFRRRVYNQLIITAGSLIFIVAIFFQQTEETAVYVPDEDQMRAELLRQKANPTYQPQAYKLDTPYFYPPKFDGTVPPYLPVKPRQVKSSDSVPAAVEQPPADTPANLVTVPGEDTYLSYDCARFYNLGSTKYIIVEGVYQDLEVAAGRMNQINETGIAANVLWLGCFLEWDNGYAVYLDLIYNTSEEALLAARSYEDMLAPQEPAGWLRIRSLTPVSR